MKSLGKICEEMLRIRDWEDRENAHKEADKLLKEAVTLLGSSSDRVIAEQTEILTKAFDSIPKWYA